MKSIEEVANELVQLQRHRYYVERYSAGLQRLTVVARPMQSAGSVRFITFRAVEYMQMPSWTTNGHVWLTCWSSAMEWEEVKLERQVAPLGTPFSATSSVISGSSATWAGALTASVVITQNVAGLHVTRSVDDGVIAFARDRRMG